MSNQWKEELRRRMSDYGEKAPDGLWENISQTMAGADVPVMPVRKTSHSVRLRYWGMRVAATLFVAALVWSGYRFLSDPAETGGTLIASGKGSSEEINRETKDCSKETAGNEERPEEAVKRLAVLTSREDMEEQQQESPEKKEDSPVEEVSVSQQTGEQTSGPVRQIPSVPYEEKRRAGEKKRDTYDRRWLASARSSRSGAKRWSIGLNTSNAGSTSNSELGDRVMGVMLSAPLGNGMLSDGMQLMSSTQHVPVFNLSRSTSTEIKHKQPVKIGASLNYAISRRWSVETGVTYSKLVSTMTSGDESQYVETEQNLHYVGIPLKATYTVWNNRHLALYVSGGGEVEKCVSGKVTVQQIRGGEVEANQAEDLSVKRLQCSALASVGAQYKLSQVVWIYVEPGMSYHFDNGENIETIYKDRPLNFQLKVGIRFQMGL